MWWYCCDTLFSGDIIFFCKFILLFSKNTGKGKEKRSVILWSLVCVYRITKKIIILFVPQKILYPLLIFSHVSILIVCVLISWAILYVRTEICNTGYYLFMLYDVHVCRKVGSSWPTTVEEPNHHQKGDIK